MSRPFEEFNPPTKVYGQNCLEYIDKPICFASVDYFGQSIQDSVSDGLREYKLMLKSKPDELQQFGGSVNLYTNLVKFEHDTSKRKVAIIKKQYDDGGIFVQILGNERFRHYTNARLRVYTVGYVFYRGADDPNDPHFVPDYTVNGWLNNPAYYPSSDNPKGGVGTSAPASDNVSYDDALNFDINDHFEETFDDWVTIDGTTYYNREYRLSFENQQLDLTNEPSTSMWYGAGLETDVTISPFCLGNPLRCCSGNLYQAIIDGAGTLLAGMPDRIDYDDMGTYVVDYDIPLHSWNACCIPYNIIITSSESEAQRYLLYGDIPSDAFLYPLDWDDIPQYTPTDEDQPEYNDNNTPDDTTWNGDPNPPTAPTYTPALLSNYNWYWLTAPELESFLNWFWNDIGTVNDWEDLVSKIEGLYNDLASAVLMVRYFPVDNNATWIGGKGNQSNINIGMVSKGGLVDTISATTVAPIELIGHTHIDRKYQSFVDLSPCSELMLYLPLHGFVDLDINIFNGHDLYVYGIYDHLSGTLQYLLYLDNSYLINSYLVKMAVDIPVTLQSKNDRDSAVFSNITSAVGGLMGAGVSMATGNPIGLLVGANAMNSGTASAPLNVKGSVGETGAFYAPAKCAIIVRRPAISKPDTWETEVGQMCGKSFTLSKLAQSHAGFTTCYNPRITFSKTVPLQSEIDEIYDYLEKGVIL